MVLIRIIFAPHEDDEVLACGGLILKSLEENIPIKIVYMTDGRACYELSNIDIGIPPEQVAEIRKNEAIECAKELGVPVDNTEFLGIYDQHLSDPLNFELALQTVKNILESYESYDTIEVFIPSNEPHPDHQATHNIVIHAVQGLGKSIPIYQYGLYRSIIGKPDLRIKLSPEMLDQKIRAYNCHKSQKFITINDVVVQNDEERFKLFRMEK
jgi:LmbE family N-acetylglucosaminyl deacetylase